MNRKMSYLGIILVIMLTGCNETNPQVKITSETKEKIQIVTPKNEKQTETSQTETPESSEATNQQPIHSPKNEPTTPTTPNESFSTPTNHTLVNAQQIAIRLVNTFQTVNKRAHLRSGASVNQPSLGEIPVGVSLLVEDAFVDPTDYRIWCYVNYNSTYGWISYKTLNPNYDLQTEYRNGT